MLTTVSNFVYGSSKENEPLELKILKKKDFRYLDPIASLVGLAQIAALPKGQDPKISLGIGRLFPKSKEAATKEWLPVCLQAKGMPSFIQSMVHSLDRTWNHDSREYLAFFNHAIPYMAMLYPTDSLDSEQNQIMKNFWKLVTDGIEVLEDSYSAELKKPLIQEEDVEPNETQFPLKLENTIGKTFAAWKYVIHGYIKQEATAPRFVNLLENPEKFKVVIEEKKFEAKNAKKSKANSAEKKEANLEKEDEPAIDSLLNDVRGKLAAFKGKLNVEDAKILHELKQVVDSTLNNGVVPRKMCPLSNKVRGEWTLFDIQDITDKINEIRKCTIDVNRDSDLLRLGEFLNKKAVKYMILVDNELDEVMTL